MPLTNSLGQALSQLLTDYAAAWRANDPDAIASYWDVDRFVFYKAEEVPDFFRQWADLIQYWRNNQALHDKIELGFRDLQYQPCADGLIAATIAMRWDILFAANAKHADGAPFAHRGQAMGGDNHVVMLIGSHPKPRLIAWSETPDAPISYMRSLYLDNVTPGFVE